MCNFSEKAAYLTTIIIQTMTTSAIQARYGMTITIKHTIVAMHGNPRFKRVSTRRIEFSIDKHILIHDNIGGQLSTKFR